MANDSNLRSNYNINMKCMYYHSHYNKMGNLENTPLCMAWEIIENWMTLRHTLLRIYFASLCMFNAFRYVCIVMFIIKCNDQTNEYDFQAIMCPAWCFRISDIRGERIWFIEASYIFQLISPSAAYMRQWIGPTLVPIMACRLFGPKPLYKPVLGLYCQLDPLEQTSAKFQSKNKIFHSRKCRRKHRLWNCGHFVQAGGWFKGSGHSPPSVSVRLAHMYLWGWGHSTTMYSLFGAIYTGLGSIWDFCRLLSV